VLKSFPENQSTRLDLVCYDKEITMKIYKSTLKKGFTMVELLVSMTITIIIIGLLVFVIRSAFDSLSQGQGNVSSYHKGKQALDQLI